MFLSLPVHIVLSVNKPMKYKLWELYTQEKEKAYYSTILTKWPSQFVDQQVFVCFFFFTE